ncbi:hypothetical protein ACIOZM_15025 [Pseudomonas sp. NPDC087346]|uniref:hypothetical protein n=1 Tax=Pseudomonas sp. NPDC087346 TaxID=3364438 RepID=UPI0038307305
MNVKQIIPCTDWFYVGDTEEGEIVLRVAAWAITDGEDVIGLLADQKMSGMPSLVAPDSEWWATYKHLRELSEYQCQLAGEKYVRN